MHYTFAVLALASSVSAHYTWSTLALNGQVQGSDWSYVREHQQTYMPTMGQDILADTFRCQPGAESGSGTQVLEAAVGDTLGFGEAFDAAGIEHPGPMQVYMSKAPGSVTEYDGSGEWFKVYQSILCTPPSGDSILTDAWSVPPPYLLDGGS